VKIQLPRAFIVGPVAVLLVAVTACGSFASGSKKETPSRTAGDNVRQATEKYNSGVKHMDKAKEYDAKADSLFAFNYRATPVAKAGNEYKQAVDDFNAAVDLNPKMVEAFNNLGFCLRKLDKLPESLNAYDKALALDSLYPKAREYRGELFLAMGKLDRANSDLDLLKRIKSPYADTLARSIKIFELSQFTSGGKKDGK
jgi:tetratricopeptide (TPR) repeat protein